jgi:serpin B
MFRQRLLSARNGRTALLIGGAGVLVSISASSNGRADAGAPPPKIAPETARAAQSAADASNGFGFRLLRQVFQEQPRENVFLSPTSLSIALAMAYNGAGGATKAAMAHALGVPDDVNAVNSDNAALQKALGTTDPKVTLSVANALWSDRRSPFSPAFVTRCEQSYHAGATTLDFTAPSAAATINDWVARATHDKITSLVTPADLAPPVSAVLTNAVYFKGLWTRPFDPKRTTDQDFTPESGAAFKVRMMHGKEKLGYLGKLSRVAGAPFPFEGVRMPYGSAKFSMYALLPNPGTTLTDLAVKLDGRLWAEWRRQFSTRTVNVAMPRFKATFEGEMKKPLSALGMAPAFRADADFSGMFTRGKNRIDKVKHKAVLEVKEEGAEAAAATAVITKRAVFTPEAPEPTVVFDRPFLCAISDDETGAVVFLGAIYHPEPLL